jgi:hypothetical protein
MHPSGHFPDRKNPPAPSDREVGTSRSSSNGSKASSTCRKSLRARSSAAHRLRIPGLGLIPEDRLG